jgi:tRNA pseudouridine32 synthase / 23S rRNA pseudouridine746 synthase
MAPKELTEGEVLARLLYRDGLMLIIDKPAGLPVHRGPKGGASVEDYFDALRFGLPRMPALAHRLDRETSGCLVLGRHRKALAHLGLLFKHSKVGKTYWALVEGGPAEDEGVVDMPLGRLDPDRGWWMKPDPNGLPSMTRWQVMGRFSPPPEGAADGREGSAVKGNGSLTWLALEPVTGRTHQLRVHCSALGFPIVGDPIYGSGPRFGGPGLQLHAREIVVPIQKSRDPVRVTAPVPEHMKERLSVCGWNGEADA